MSLFTKAFQSHDQSNTVQYIIRWHITDYRVTTEPFCSVFCPCCLFGLDEAGWAFPVFLVFSLSHLFFPSYPICLATENVPQCFSILWNIVPFPPHPLLSKFLVQVSFLFLRDGQSHFRSLFWLITHAEDFLHVFVYYVGDADGWDDLEEIRGDATIQAWYTFVW